MKYWETYVGFILRMAIKAYKKKLKYRPIKEGMEEIKDAKEILAENLMEEAKL